MPPRYDVSFALDRPRAIRTQGVVSIESGSSMWGTQLPLCTIFVGVAARGNSLLSALSLADSRRGSEGLICDTCGHQARMKCHAALPQRFYALFHANERSSRGTKRFLVRRREQQTRSSMSRTIYVTRRESISAAFIDVFIYMSWTFQLIITVCLYIITNITCIDKRKYIL